MITVYYLALIWRMFLVRIDIANDFGKVTNDVGVIRRNELFEAAVFLGGVRKSISSFGCLNQYYAVQNYYAIIHTCHACW